jgi:hypothetical protein
VGLQGLLVRHGLGDATGSTQSLSELVPLLDSIQTKRTSLKWSSIGWVSMGSTSTMFLSNDCAGKFSPRTLAGCANDGCTVRISISYFSISASISKKSSSLSRLYHIHIIILFRGGLGMLLAGELFFFEVVSLVFIFLGVVGLLDFIFLGVISGWSS